MALEKIKEQAKKAEDEQKPRLESAQKAVCSVDVGFAFFKALRNQKPVQELVTSPAKAGLEALRGYALLGQAPECAATWNALLQTSVTPDELERHSRR